jgi:hypothetical protein
MRNIYFLVAVWGSLSCGIMAMVILLGHFIQEIGRAKSPLLKSMPYRFSLKRRMINFLASGGLCWVGMVVFVDRLAYTSSTATWTTITFYASVGTGILAGLGVLRKYPLS